MSQNPNGGPNYDPYGPGPSNPNYPPVPGTGYGNGQPPSGPNPYGQYTPPAARPGEPTPNSSYGSPYAPPPPPANQFAPMPSRTDPSSGPYGAYDPTVISQKSGASYPAYPPSTDGPAYPPYGQSSAPGGPTYPTYPPSGAPGGQYPAYPSPGGVDFNTPSPQKPKKNNARTVLIAIIALIILVGGALGVVFYTNHETGIRNAANTATSQTQVVANATINAQATAAYTKTHYPFSTNLVLNDPLSNDSNVPKYGWDTASGCAFTSSTYQVTIDQAGYFSYCTASKVSFSNFTYEVQMSIQKGGNNASGGVVFRANMSSSLFYVFYLSSTGVYDLDIQTNSNATNTRILKSGSVPGFASGLSQVHTIGIVANGPQVSVYVDQSQVTQVSDSTFTSGQVGVISDYGNSTTVVVYNNAKVWQL